MTLKIMFLFQSEENKSRFALWLSAGLPDGFFSNQTSQFGQFLEGLRWEYVDIFRAFWNILWTFWDIVLSFGSFVFI
jgi:hypothetical protein